jgi:hypothetical protein
VARKTNADASASGKISKPKRKGQKSTTVKGRRLSSKKPAVRNTSADAPAVARTAFDPTDQQIEMRAYFISERRRRFDLPGDANSDWLEAKRQLLAETRH